MNKESTDSGAEKGAEGDKFLAAPPSTRIRSNGAVRASDSVIVEAKPPRRKPGRPKGAVNKTTAEIKEMIMKRGKPVELLCDVSRGVKIRIGPQAGPDKAFAYPDLDARIAAANILLKKLVPDTKAVELAGPDGKPLVPDVPKLSTLELARRILFILAKAKREAEEVNGPAGPAEAAPGGASGFSHLVPEPAPEPEPERTALVSGEVAWFTGHSIRCEEPQRPGLPVQYVVYDSGGGRLTSSTGGWQGALAYVRALAGDGDMSMTITKPEPEPSRPDQRGPRSKQRRSHCG